MHVFSVLKMYIHINLMTIDGKRKKWMKKNSLFKTDK